jgi:hypothetical protein
MSVIENGLIRYRSFSEEIVDILDRMTQLFSGVPNPTAFHPFS